jgi:hypothetical protein
MALRQEVLDSKIQEIWIRFQKKRSLYYTPIPPFLNFCWKNLDLEALKKKILKGFSESSIYSNA